MPIKFHHSVQFARINAEAQRGFPNHIKPPYLTWHFATWPELGTHPEDASEVVSATELRRAWMEKNDKFISYLTGGKSKGFSQKFRAKGEQVQDTLRGNVLTIEGLFFNSAILLRVEFHEEYNSYTFVLPVKALPHEQESTIEVGQDRLGAIYGQPHTATDESVDRIVSDIWANIDFLSGETITDYKYRSAEQWDRLYNEAWKVAFRGLNSDGQAPVLPPGCVFANFRGIVLPRDWLVKAHGSDETERHIRRLDDGLEQFVPSDLEGLPKVLPREELRSVMGLSDSQLGAEVPETPRRWNRVSAGRVLFNNSALRHALHWVDGHLQKRFLLEPHFHRRTVSNLAISGRALYASALSTALDNDFGSTDESLDISASKTASRYCVFYCSEKDASSQSLLGRRLDRLSLRLHSMGVLRLIALKDIDGLKLADEQLTLIEKRITQVGSGISMKRYSRNDIQGLYNRLNELSNDITGSIDYRVAKSELYSNQFKRLVTSESSLVNAGRIEGWEPYSEFVSRRLYEQFDNINRIGERLSLSRERLDRIMELVNLDRTVELSEDAKTLAEKMVRVGRYTLVIAVLALFLSLGGVLELVYDWLSNFLSSAK